MTDTTAAPKPGISGSRGLRMMRAVPLRVCAGGVFVCGCGVWVGVWVGEVGGRGGRGGAGQARSEGCKVP